jgi:aminopeptidase-like protein
MKRVAYIMAYGNGEHDLIDIAERAGQPAWKFGPELDRLLDIGLISVGPESDGANQVTYD